MMDQTNSNNKSMLLASFFLRLAGLNEVVKIIVCNARITALLVFRGEPEKRVLMDLTKDKLNIIGDDQAKDANIYVAIRDTEMHKILTGEKTAGVALSERELLLRGSPYLFSKFIPLFAFGPMLYAEHLADCGAEAYQRSTNYAPLKEVYMNTQDTNVVLEKYNEVSFLQKMIFKLFNMFAFVLGYIVGFFRFRVFENMSLFDIISSLSNGLEAATPKAQNANQTKGIGAESK